MRYVLRAIDRTRDGYAWVVRRFVRVAIVGTAVVAGTRAASALLLTLTPPSFLPDADQGALALPLGRPVSGGLGSTGGFQCALGALQGQSASAVAAGLRGVVVAANAAPELPGVDSSYAAAAAEVYLDVDRDKAQVVGVKI